MTEPKIIDWSKILIRCSSLSCLFTQPVTKADKDAGELSKTAKTHLKSIYIREKYGREKDILTKQMQKGTEVEEINRQMLNRVLKSDFKKNEHRLSNEFITGYPDGFSGESVDHADSIVDIKSSYDLFTFINNIGESLNSDYYYQIQGYMFLSGCEQGYIAYCLGDTPNWIIEGEKYRLLRAMNVISEDDPAYKIEALKIENSMTFSDIAEDERILLFPVKRDDEIMAQIPKRVEKAREYLEYLEEKHFNFNKTL